MNSSIEYVLALLGALALWILWALRKVNIIDYFKTDTGKGILKGIVLAVLFSVALVAMALLQGCAGSYINDVSVFTGLDYTKKESPSCDTGTVDSHSTSNLGLKANIYQTDDKRFRASGKYTHHSCAFGTDSNQYDAVGVELEYKLWEK